MIAGCARRRGWLTALAVGMMMAVGAVLARERCTGTPAALGSEAGGQTPRLLVMVVFDQLRADYLERWADLFGEGGFRRLQTDGAWFQNCHYPYAYTFTGPGHASLATGCSPSRHGIVNNEWYDRDAGAVVDAVAGPLGGAGASAKVVSPDRLAILALADRLKDVTHSRSRVVSLSLKDRSAVLLGGHRPDVCCWFDPAGGVFQTSAYYRGGLPVWVGRFNAGHPMDRWAGQEWRRLRPNLDYARRSGPDDVPGEGTGERQGRTFPHPFAGGARPPAKAYYKAVYDSPFGNEILLELAERAVDAEQLGRRDVSDLLCLSFSSTDSIGHIWGPDSQEALDGILRADRVMRRLLDILDARVGKGRYLLALTADHGVCPLPEVSRAAGYDTGRVDPVLLALRAEAFLGQQFGKPGARRRWLEGVALPWLYLNRKLIRERDLRDAAVEDALAEWLRHQSGILAAFTASRLAGRPLEIDDLERRVRRSFYAGRCGDVCLVVKPYYILWPAIPGTGTTHGSPHSYDTHVPLLLYGPGMAADIHKEPVTPQSLVALFAHAVHLKLAAEAETAPP